MAEAKRNYTASVAYGIDQAVIESNVAAGHISLEKSTITIEDAKRGVEKVEASFEVLKALDQDGAYLLAGGDETRKDKDGKEYTYTAAQKLADLATYAAALKARSKSRADYLDSFGTVDEGARITRMVENFVKMGLTKSQAEAAVAQALAQRANG